MATKHEEEEKHKAAEAEKARKANQTATGDAEKDVKDRHPDAAKDHPDATKDHPDATKDQQDARHSNVAAAGGAISHPSVAAIVSADPGGRAGPDIDTMLVQPGDPLNADAAPRTFRLKAIEDTPVIDTNPLADFAPNRDERVKPVGQEQLERSEANERTLGHTVGGLTPRSQPAGVVQGVAAQRSSA